MPNQTGQTLDGVIDGLVKLAESAFGTSLDATYGAQVGTFRDLPIVVEEGAFGSYQPDLMLVVGIDVRQDVTRPTFGTTRSRERTVEIDIGVSAQVSGAPPQAIPDSRRLCNAMVDAYEDYFRTQGNETLSASCREAFVSKVQGPTPAPVLSDDSTVILGYFADAVITVTAYIRY